jgi:hypothetical protein
MRITKNQLRQIIKEELAGVLGEGDYIPSGPKDPTEDDENIVDSLPLPVDPELKPGEKKKIKDVGKPGYNPPKEKPPAIPMKENRRRKVRRK